MPRYSSDQQNPSSVEDQLLVCREGAEREGWQIVGSYDDPGISGASVVLRPGVQGMEIPEDFSGRSVNACAGGLPDPARLDGPGWAKAAVALSA